MPTTYGSSLETWTLLHMKSPLNTDRDESLETGQIGELTTASSRKLTFSTVDADTLSFDMPGNHLQTARITPLVDDVLVFRGEVPVQRFRVVSRQLSKDSGVLKAQFTAVAYKALLDAWIFHDAEPRSFVATEQTDIAWEIIRSGLSTFAGADMGLSRGTLPQTLVVRDLIGSIEEGGDRPEYFLPGMKRREAIDNVSNMINGFEWSIDPDPLDPYRLLKFNTWNVGKRTVHPDRSPLVLDDGGSMTSWSHTVTPTDYGNVIRHTGTSSVEEGQRALEPVWWPSTRNPVEPAPEGRWERDINNSDLTTQSAVDSYARSAYEQVHDYVPEISANLRRGVWRGPGQLWVGDKARFIVTEPVDGVPGEWILYIDEDVRVIEVNVDVDEQGAEDVSLALNRPPFSSDRDARRVYDRLTRLERR